MSSVLLESIGSSVVRAMTDIGYWNVGTLEFLVDERKNFYFMEMNTRIQVEHPWTELVTGIDLVRDQILIAAGEKLPHRQDDIHFRGHALECRINAEDPVTHKPSPGKITSWHAPGGPGVRIDTAAYAEYVIPPYYDSLIAKLAVHGSTRDEAIRPMERLADARGVHLGQTDLPPAAARKILGFDAIIGFSTHNLNQALAADEFPIDYMAVGPIFPTSTKENPDPVVGLRDLAAIAKAVH